jgi:hypothetical protein
MYTLFVVETAPEAVAFGDVATIDGGVGAVGATACANTGPAISNVAPTISAFMSFISFSPELV